MEEGCATLTLALPDGQQWTCRLRPEVVGQLIATARHANDAMVYVRRQVAQIRQRIAELPGQERDAHLIDRSVVLQLLGEGA
jgi:hypothetical protein